MSDDQNAGQNTDSVDSGTDDVEAKFWTKLDQRIDAAIDRGVQKYARPAGQRTGRTTLPGMLANFMFGPEKEPEKK